MNTVIPSIFTAIDRFTAPVQKMARGAGAAMARLERNSRQVSKAAFDTSRKAAIVGLAFVAPMALAAKAAVNFEDKMSDIGKTTGLKGAELKDFGNTILDMSKKTRSSIDDLSVIAEIGGRLGITGSKNLKAFTSSANEFAVALGGDFSGGVEAAITQFGKVTSLFKDTKDLDISEALKKSGSAMNALSAKGVNVEGLTDFSLRIGSLSDSIKPTLSQTTALGAVLQKAGLSSEIASSGFKSFLGQAGNNLPAFARQMGITTKEATNLFNTDSAKFFVDFAASMDGMKADQMSKKLKTLKLNSNEVRGVVGLLASKQEDYNKMLNISTNQMDKGTSITEEYNTKNNNTAGKLAQLKNNMQGLIITIGNALIPVITNLMESVTPIINSIAGWMGRNKGLTSTIVKVALGIAALSFAVSGVSAVIGVAAKLSTLYAVAMGVVGAVSGTASIAIGQSDVALKAYNVTTKIVTAATWLWNAAMTANPIGAVIAAVVLATAAIYGLSKAFSSQTSAEKLNGEVRARALENTIDQRVEITTLFNTLNRAKQGTEQYSNALSQLEKMQPGITEKYNLQEKSIKRLDAAQKELTATLMKKATMEARAEMAKEKIKEAQQMRDKDLSASEKYVAWISGMSQNQYKETIAGSKEREAEYLLNQNSNQEFKDSQAAVNPAKTKKDMNSTQTNNNNTSEKVTIDFSNMPDWVKVMTGSGNGGNSFPSLGTTRK